MCRVLSPVVSAPAAMFTTECANPPVTGYSPEIAAAMLDAPRTILEGENTHEIRRD